MGKTELDMIRFRSEMDDIMNILKNISFILFLFLITSLFIAMMEKSVEGKDAGDIVTDSPDVRCNIDDRYLTCSPFPVAERDVTVSGTVSVHYPVVHPENVDCIVHLSLASHDLIFQDPPSMVLSSDRPEVRFNISIRIPEEKADSGPSELDIFCVWHTTDGIYQGSFDCETVKIRLEDQPLIEMELEETEIVIGEHDVEEIDLILTNNGFGYVSYSISAETDDDTLHIEIVNDEAYRIANGSTTWHKKVMIGHTSSREDTSKVMIVVEYRGSSSRSAVSENITVRKLVDPHSIDSRSYFKEVIVPLMVLAILLFSINIVTMIITGILIKKRIERSSRKTYLNDIKL